MPGIAIDPRTVETNLVFFDVAALGITAANGARRPSPTACA